MNLNLKAAFNFNYTPEQETRAAQSIKSAQEFMKIYGAGRLPRMHGEYYAPGTAPTDGKWLPARAAMEFLGLTSSAFVKIASSLERRLYRSKNGRNYFEYSLECLVRTMKSIQQSNPEL